MPYVPVEKYNQWEEDFKKNLDQHGEEIKSQKNITLFFTIIAGITLVATLVAVASLFFIFFSDYIHTSKNYIEKTAELQKELEQVSNEILMLRTKNPYLK